MTPISSIGYYWKDNEVREVDLNQNGPDETAFTGYFCIDSRFDRDLQRYGIFTERHWKHIPFEKFPSEFKTHLLLLGVS